MTREEIKDFCDMKAQLEPENEDIYKAIVKALEQEPTTKNGLGVDCISRAYLLDDSKYHTVFNDDTGNFEDVVYREDIEKAPSVTPQKSKTGWLSIDDVMSVFDDFMCGDVDEEGTETFLEMLKDKAESEVEE